MKRIAIAACLLLASFSRAGVHYSKEEFADLPAQWRGFLLDHRSLRGIASPGTADAPATTQRVQYDKAAKELEAKKDLSADELADLGALLIRLNRIDAALEVLRGAATKHPKHFRIAANLGSAWQLSGDLRQAERQLANAVDLAPDRWKTYEQAHLRLVQKRLAKKEGIDDLFGVPFTGTDGKPSAEKIAPEQRARLPKNDVALLQQLALWFPNDGLLLWQLAELANAHGDVRTAASLLEGCVGEYGLGVGDIRDRRRIYTEASDAIGKLPDAEHVKHRGDIAFAGGRALLRRIDLAQLPAISTTGATLVPWVALGETTVARPFNPQHIDFLKQLDGKRVTLTGFQRSDADTLEVDSFLLVEYPVGCWYCDVPDATGIVKVAMTKGAATAVQRGVVRIEGTLKLNRNDPEDYLFSVVDAKMKAVD